MAIIKMDEPVVRKWGTGGETKVTALDIEFPDGGKLKGNLIERFPHPTYGSHAVRFLDLSEYCAMAVYSWPVTIGVEQNIMAEMQKWIVYPEKEKADGLPTS